MTDKTIQLTTEEIANIDTVMIVGGVQQVEMLALRKRTGIRYGVQVAAGRFDIVTVAYTLNKKGRPTGYGDVTIIRGNLTAAEVVPAIRSL